MAGRPRFFTGLVAVSVAIAWCAACGGTSPSAPGPGPTSPAVVSLSIRGLPEPLLVDVPPSLKAGQRIPLTVVATLADGSSTTAKPSALAWSSKEASIASFEGDTLVAHREGVVDIRVATPDGQTSTEMTVSVRSNAPVVIERDRATSHAPALRTRARTAGARAPVITGSFPFTKMALWS